MKNFEVLAELYHPDVLKVWRELSVFSFCLNLCFFSTSIIKYIIFPSPRIPCTFTTYALLGSYNVQAELGEFDPSDHGSSNDYIRNMSFAPHQNPELLDKIAELHRQHKYARVLKKTTYVTKFGIILTISLNSKYTPKNVKIMWSC